MAATGYFAAVRGRLDLLSWAFTCFVFVMAWVSRRQAFTPPDRLGADKHTWSVAIDMLCITLPILAGAMLVALSFSLSTDPNGPASEGSHAALVTANHVLLTILSLSLFNFLFFLVVGALVRQWPLDFSEDPHEFASHFVHPSQRWEKYRCAGEGAFSEYRAQACFVKSRLEFDRRVSPGLIGHDGEVAAEELELESQTAGVKKAGDPEASSAV